MQQHGVLPRHVCGRCARHGSVPSGGHAAPERRPPLPPGSSGKPALHGCFRGSRSENLRTLRRQPAAGALGLAQRRGEGGAGAAGPAARAGWASARRPRPRSRPTAPPRCRAPAAPPARAPRARTTAPAAPAAPNLAPRARARSRSWAGGGPPWLPGRLSSYSRTARPWHTVQLAAWPGPTMHAAWRASGGGRRARLERVTLEEGEQVLVARQEVPRREHKVGGHRARPAALGHGGQDALHGQPLADAHWPHLHALRALRAAPARHGAPWPRAARGRAATAPALCCNPLGARAAPQPAAGVNPCLKYEALAAMRRAQAPAHAGGPTFVRGTACWGAGGRLHRLRGARLHDVHRRVRDRPRPQMLQQVARLRAQRAGPPLTPPRAPAAPRAAPSGPSFARTSPHAHSLGSDRARGRDSCRPFPARPRARARQRACSRPNSTSAYL